MKKFYLLLFGLASAACGAYAQITIKANTQLAATPGSQITSTTGIRNAANSLDLSNVSLMLVGSAPWLLSNTGTGESIIGDLTVDGASDYTVSGKWRVANSLTLTKGKLIVDLTTASPGRLLYTGASDVVGGNDDSFVEGIFYSHGLGPRTFPVGNSDGYFPIRLDNVVDDAEIGFEIITGDANLDFSSLTGITDLLRDRYWQMSPVSGTLTGSTISVSSNLVNAFLLSGRAGGPTILEQDRNMGVINLGGLSVGEFITSATKNSATGKIYAIAKTEDVLIKISEVLTPNGDGKNNVLKISNIELYPDNKVILLDRYGVEVHHWSGFKNYSTTDASQDFDFSSLAIGNYICVVEFTDPRTGSQKVSQMITVLK